MKTNCSQSFYHFDPSFHTCSISLLRRPNSEFSFICRVSWANFGLLMRLHCCCFLDKLKRYCLKKTNFFPSLLNTLLANLVLKYFNKFLSFILSHSNCIEDEHSLELCYVFWELLIACNMMCTVTSDHLRSPPWINYWDFLFFISI